MNVDLGVPVIAAERCHRLQGKGIADCTCRLPDEGGWAECPPEARGILVATRDAPPKLSGDSCQECGSFQMVRTGSCATCQACGYSGSCG